MRIRGIRGMPGIPSGCQASPLCGTRARKVSLHAFAATIIITAGGARKASSLEGLRSAWTSYPAEGIAPLFAKGRELYFLDSDRATSGYNSIRLVTLPQAASIIPTRTTTGPTQLRDYVHAGTAG